MKLLICTVLILICVCPAFAGLIWMDGTTTDETAPPGKLLSDNGNYWGDCVFTGMTRTGTGAGTVFDFKRKCTFSEVDFTSETAKVGVKLECGSFDTGWQVVCEMKPEESINNKFHRIKLATPVTGERLKLTLTSPEEAKLGQVWAWGDAQVTADDPEQIWPLTQTLPAGHYRTYSIPGIERTAIREGQFRNWVESLGELAKQPGVWSRVPTWDIVSGGPILPAVQDINPQIGLTMARNETECAALALTNTSGEATLNADVVLDSFKNVSDGKPAAGIAGKLRVMGAIPSAVYGVCMSPLFEQDNMPGASIMRRYIANADTIKDFPQLHLPPTASAIVWVSVTTDGSAPGVYEATLSFKGGPAAKVRVEVLDVTLPRATPWVVTYCSVTEMQPFQYTDRAEREAQYKYSIGTTVWDGWPEPGPRNVARKLGKVDYRIYALPGKYMHPVALNDEDKKAIIENVRAISKRAKDLGLSYDDWYLELWDEPNVSNLDYFGQCAALIKQADPKVRVYCNPTTGNIGDWYNKYVDISCPYVNAGISDKETQWLFNAPRKVRAFYKLLANCSKNESRAHMDRYRGLAWEAMSRGWNGWGFYAYHAPGGDPWNDFDAAARPGDEPDWTTVYPGPRGPIPSRASESLREGYEDYCLISLLRSQGKGAVADDILKRFVPADAGEGKRGTGQPLEVLRLEALRAAAQASPSIRSAD